MVRIQVGTSTSKPESPHVAPRRAAIKPYVVWFLTEGFHESLEIVKVTVLHHHDFWVEEEDSRASVVDHVVINCLGPRAVKVLRMRHASVDEVHSRCLPEHLYYLIKVVLPN